MLKDGPVPSKPSNPFMDKEKDPSSGFVPASRVGTSEPRPDDEVVPKSPPTAQHILVMLLRLRQCCCHLSLMKDVSRRAEFIDLIRCVFKSYVTSVILSEIEMHFL